MSKNKKSEHYHEPMSAFIQDIKAIPDVAKKEIEEALFNPILINTDELLIGEDTIIAPKHDRKVAIEQLLNNKRYQFEGACQWLEFYLENRAELKSELVFSEKINLKPFAELLRAQLYIAQQIYLKCALIQQKCNSPGHLWVAWIFNSFKFWLRCEYKESSLAKGGKEDFRRDVSTNASEAALAISDPESSYIKPFYRGLSPEYRYLPPQLLEALRVGNHEFFDKHMENGHLSIWLERTALAIAQDEKDFDQDYWAPYCRAKRRWGNTVRSNSHWQITHVDEDGLQSTAKSKQVSKTRKRRK